MLRSLTMRIVVTGSAGHLGEGIVRRLNELGQEVVGLDRLDSPFTTRVGSILDYPLLLECFRGADAVVHAATLHKPHVATHPEQAFVETNVAGTLSVLEAALESRVGAFVYSSTTSVFGAALRPDAGQPAAWADEDLFPIPRNIYGVTKRAAEDLCQLFQRSKGLPCVVLRNARFFPEEDDEPGLRQEYEDLNLKVNEYLFRRLDLADAVEAHLLAAERAPELGFGRYVISATSPFERQHLARLPSDAAGVVGSLFPDYEAVYAERGWKMFPGIERVYVNRRAREELGWRPRFDFGSILDSLRSGDDVFSPLAAAVGSKGYHSRTFDEGPYPVVRDEEGPG